MKIRAANESDIQAIFSVYESARDYMHTHGNPTQWTGGYPGLSDIREDLCKGQLYVCTEEPETGEGRETLLAAFAFFIGDEPNYAVIEDGAWLNDAPYGVIHRIAAAKAARGKGAAAFCMAWAAAQTDNLRVDTHADNLPMQGLLQKFGFRRVGIIRLPDGGSRIAFHRAESGAIV